MYISSMRDKQHTESNANLLTLSTLHYKNNNKMELIKTFISDSYRVEMYLIGESNHKYWSHKIMERVVLFAENRTPFGSETRYHSNAEKDYDGKWVISKGMKYLDRPLTTEEVYQLIKNQ